MMFFIFQKKDFLDLLEIVKEEIYKGHKLLSDPIMYNLENSENSIYLLLFLKYIFR